MSESMCSKPLDGLKCFFLLKMNCQLPYFPWLMTSFMSAVLCVIFSPHYVCNIFVSLYVLSPQQNTVQTLSMRNVELSKLLVDGVP